jgi:hypothetical protein
MGCCDGCGAAEAEAMDDKVVSSVVVVVVVVVIVLLVTVLLPSSWIAPDVDGSVVPDVDEAFASGGDGVDAVVTTDRMALASAMVVAVIT